MKFFCSLSVDRSLLEIIACYFETRFLRVTALAYFQFICFQSITWMSSPVQWHFVCSLLLTFLTLNCRLPFFEMTLIYMFYFNTSISSLSNLKKSLEILMKLYNAFYICKYLLGIVRCHFVTRILGVTTLGNVCLSVIFLLPFNNLNNNIQISANIFCILSYWLDFARDCNMSLCDKHFWS